MLDDILNIVNILKYFTLMKMISSLSIYVGLFGVGNIYMLLINYSYLRRLRFHLGIRDY